MGSDEARSEQIEIGAPVHLALERFQFVDLALCLTVGPRLAEGGLVRAQASGKRCKETALSTGPPPFQVVVFAVSDHGSESSS